MNQPATQQLTEREASEATQLTPLNLIRTETVLSRLPIHNLAKKGRVDIQITKKNERGEVDVHWEVSYSDRYGQARQLAYKLDTIIINQKIDELRRPLPRIIRLGSLRQICRELGLRISGDNANDLKKAIHQNAGAYITAKLRYRANDGTEKTLEAGFTRYSVIFTGERLPNGTKADAVYLVLNDIYLDVLNNAPTRPLDYTYLKELPPSAQRFYEIVSYKIFTALKYRHPHAKLLYSDYCTFSAQRRYYDYDHFKKQMYKVHKPHKTSGYLEKVSYEASIDSAGNPDWMMFYVPGPKAKAEYQTCNGNKKRGSVIATESEPLLPFPPTTDKPKADDQPNDRLAAQAADLINYFHERFHGTTNNDPHPNALDQASRLITHHGIVLARHVVDFAYGKAQETHYAPQTFGGILQYTPRALAAFEETRRKEIEEAVVKEEQRKAQEQEQLRRHYENWRRDRLAELRATAPPDTLTAIEQAVCTQFDQDNTIRFGRDLLRRIVIDNAIAAHFEVPSLEDWRAARGHGNALASTSPYPGNLNQQPVS